MTAAPTSPRHSKFATVLRVTSGNFMAAGTMLIAFVPGYATLTSHARILGQREPT